MLKLKHLGNTRIPHRKHTSTMPPIKIDPPHEILLSTVQHIGSPARPIVKVGDEVKVGQLVAESTGYISSPIYSPVSGKVVKIEPCLKSNGKYYDAIRIENDGLMTVCEGITPPVITNLDSLTEAVRASGIVGLGGAGFPTVVKFDGAKKCNIDTIIINGAECEPYITVDARTMLDSADMILEGIKLLKKTMPSVKNYVFGIEGNKPEAIKEMTELFKDDDSVKIEVLPSLYPQGAEKVLIYNTTGRTVPEGKLPSDVGVIVINVTTLATVARYVENGMPLIERCITIDGSAIKEPKNVTVPIGTPIRDIIEFAGGFSEKPGKVILGGPMTGSAVCSLDEPIIKTSNAIVALTEKDATHRTATACIHCGKCVDACPHSLNPTAFSKMLDIENVDERMAMLEKYSLNLCMECGCCSFVCPASRPLTENIRTAKCELKEYKAHKDTLK